MKKRMTALFLAFALILTLLPAAVLTAGAETYTGECGNWNSDLKWTLNTETGVLEISGTGDMGEWWDPLDVPWVSYQNSIKTVSIGDGVTGISSYAFCKCAGLTAVTIPDSVTSIRNAAFYECAALTGVTIPDGVTYIGASVFFGCAGLKSVTIPKCVSYIAEDSFGGCTGLANVYYAGTEKMWNTIYIALGNDCLTAANLAFGGDAVVSGTYGEDSDLIWSLDTDTGALEITGNGPLNMSHDYGSYDNVVSDVSSPWKQFCKIIKTVKIGQGVTSIGDVTFGACTGLMSVKIPDTVTSIGNYAFSGCLILPNITIPNSVTSIGDYAFSGCGELTGMTIPSSVTHIGYGAFHRCAKLPAVTVDADNPAYCCVDGVLYSKDKTELIWYPSGKGSSTFSIPAGVTIIGAAAFRACSGLTRITIPNTVTVIGDNAFDGCTGLTSITIPNSVTSIGNEAFDECTGLTSIAIPNSVTSIGYEAFGYCTALTSVTIGSGAESIALDAFEDCTGLTSIEVAADNAVYSSKDGVLYNKEQTELICCPVGKTGAFIIPSGVTIIGKNAFFRCSGLTSVTIPDGVTIIDDKAFWNCFALTSLTFPDSVMRIGYNAFEYCWELTSVTIGIGMTEIDDGAFASCTNITDVYYAGTEALWNAIDLSWGNECLTDANIHYGGKTVISGTCGDDLTWTLNAETGVLEISGTGEMTRSPWKSYRAHLFTATVGEGVTSISDRAFYYCTELTSITLPGSLASIAESAFCECDSLTDVSYSGNIVEWYRIEIGNNNGCLTSANIHFGSEIGENVISGTCGEHMGWFFDAGTGVLEILGSGQMSYYSIDESVEPAVTTAPWGAYRDAITAVKIGSGVKSIGYNAFYGCAALTSVVLPDTLSAIDSGAFVGCTALTGFTVDANSEYYSSGDGVLYSKDGTALELCPAGKTGAFTIPAGVEAIRANAFNGCAGLTSVTVPDSVTSIGGAAFYRCTGLTAISLPDSVTSIGSGAFADTGYYNDAANWTDSALYIGNHLIEMMDGEAFSFVIREGTKTLASSAFAYCPALVTIYIPGSVTDFSEYAFGYTNIWYIFYGGTEEDWEAIHKSAENDLYFANHFFNAKPEDIHSVSGYCGENVTWTLDLITGALEISGTGEMDNYSSMKDSDTPPPWCGLPKTVTIGEGVTHIGSFAFYDCYSLTNITIPEGVTSVGSWAFYCCPNLTQVTLPDSLTSIEPLAFYDCPALNEITIPGNVTSIGMGAFDNCTSLTSVTLPDSVTDIGANAFIDTGYYNNAENWTDGVLYIGNHLIRANTALSGKFKVRANTKSIAGGAFSGCRELTGIEIPKSVAGIGNDAFSGCASLPKVVIPEGVSSIGTGTFAYCSALTEFTIPASVKRIGSHAFYCCTELASITIPSSVTSIGMSAFSDCSALRSITIPDSVTCIGSSAFDNTAYYGNEANWTDDALYINNHLIGVRNTISGKFSVRAGTLSIAGGAFGNCSGMTDISLPAGLKGIGNSAFSNCTELASIVIPESVTCIEEGAFTGCKSLQSITIPENVMLNSDFLFSGCSALESVSLPSGLTYFGMEMFSHCTSLKSYTIPEGVKRICESAFSFCTGLTSITIPNSVWSIEESAFYNCDALTDVFYNGTAAQWNKISIRRWNECLTEATVHFEPIAPGDMNGDGDVDTIDAIRLAKFLVDLVELTDEQKQAADINGDGDVTALDGIRLAKYLVGLVETLRPEPAKAAPRAAAK